jgi:hypothetical protein
VGGVFTAQRGTDDMFEFIAASAVPNELSHANDKAVIAVSTHKTFNVLDGNETDSISCYCSVLKVKFQIALRSAVIQCIKPGTTIEILCCGRHEGRVLKRSSINWRDFQLLICFIVQVFSRGGHWHSAGHHQDLTAGYDVVTRTTYKTFNTRKVSNKLGAIQTSLHLVI